MMFTSIRLAAVILGLQAVPPDGPQLRPPPEPDALRHELLSRFIAGTEKDLTSSRKTLAALEAENDPTQRWVVDVFRRRVDRLERELAALRAGQIAPLPPDPPDPEAWRWSLFFLPGSEPLRQSLGQVGTGLKLITSRGVGFPLLIPSPNLRQGVQTYFIGRIEFRLSLEKRHRERLEQSPNARPRILATSKRAEERFLRDLGILRAGGFSISVLRSLLPGSEP